MKNRFLYALILLLIGSLLASLPMFVFYIQQHRTMSPDEQSIDQLLDIIGQEYHTAVDISRLKNETIDFVLSSLDKHSRFLSPKQNQDSRASILGHFGGIGVNYIHSQDTIIITRVEPHLYAAKAGLKSGDRIVQVDSAKGNSHELAPLIKGLVNTTVELTVKRLNIDSVLTVRVTRGKVDLPSVEFHRDSLHKRVYVAIRFFSYNTRNELIKALKLMQKDDRLIIDLRDNGGGLLRACINISDLFLPKGSTIVSVSNTNKETYEQFKAAHPARYTPKSIHILVNKNTASASEIFASALQDHGLATVYGSQTYGKGLVQTEFQLDNGSLMRLTTATYKTPKGRFIQKPYESKFTIHKTVFDSIYGVSPDVAIASDQSFMVMNEVVQSKIDDLENQLVRIADKNNWTLSYDQFMSLDLNRYINKILPQKARIPSVYTYYRTMLALYCLSQSDFVKFKYNSSFDIQKVVNSITN